MAGDAVRRPIDRMRSVSAGVTAASAPKLFERGSIFTRDERLLQGGASHASIDPGQPAAITGLPASCLTGRRGAIGVNRERPPDPSIAISRMFNGE